MQWLERLLPPGSFAAGLVVLALAVVAGLALGNVRVRGIGLGVSGVLFAGLAMGAAGLSIRADVLAFLRDFALILFVYALGLQVGPGFIASLRSDGLRWNVIGVVVTAGGALVCAAVVWALSIHRAAAPGIYAGAYATTPALAAGQSMLRDRLTRADPRPADLDAIVRAPALAYAVTYPFGIVGPILVIVAIRRLFAIDVDRERRDLLAAEARRNPRVGVIDVRLTTGELVGVKLAECPRLREEGVRLVRLLRDKQLSVPTGQTVLRNDDVVRAVGPRPALARLLKCAGRSSRIDLARVGGPIDRRELVVTRRATIGQTLRELALPGRFGVEVARLARGGIEMPPRANLPLKYGDVLTAVGPEAGLRLAGDAVGNSGDQLNRPLLIPLFVGIVLGVIAGTAPIPVPGITGGVRLGLAGGPMLVAILLARLGNVGSLVWYMPVAATNLLRDFGLAVFLACVGLESGADFVRTIASAAGLTFVAAGAVVTVVPMFAVALFLRAAMRMNFVELCGVTCGAMTSSPALAFASDFTKSNAPAVGYASIYPLGTLVPIVGAQLLVIFLS